MVNAVMLRVVKPLNAYAESVVMLSVMMVNVVMPLNAYAESVVMLCHYGECCYAASREATQCLCRECRYAVSLW